jgi:FtsZ-binding cell division protein ZapB
MISLEQIRLLEAKINKAVDLINHLREENQVLQKAVDSAQAKMQDLETLVEDFKADQSDIEESIKRAIRNLDQLEGDLSDSAAHHDPDTAPQRETSGPAAEGADGVHSTETPSADLSEIPDGGASGELDIF